MFTNKENKKKKFISNEGIVLKPDWTETLLNMNPGEERIFERQILTTTQARVLISRMNKQYPGRRFTSRTIGRDDAVAIHREN